jgi:membrane-associated phospholipid phosphatase
VFFPLLDSAGVVRLQAVSRLIRTAAPPELAPVYGAITMLGGSTFLMVALAALFWAVDERRREVALVVSFAFTALSVTIALKAGLAMPRPPASARLLGLHSDPYGFPSGHAVAAVVVYGGFASVVDRFRGRRGLLAAAAIAALIGLSRVVLGVHYLGDVLAGAALGIALLWGLLRATGGDPVRGFAIAAVAAVPAVIVAGVASEAALALGGSLGGVAGGRAVDRFPGGESRRRRLALVVVGVGYLGAIRLASGALEGVVGLSIALNFLLVAGILLLPAVAERLGAPAPTATHP